jgi:hypothetical protein
VQSTKHQAQFSKTNTRDRVMVAGALDANLTLGACLNEIYAKYFSKQTKKKKKKKQ